MTLFLNFSFLRLISFVNPEANIPAGSAAIPIPDMRIMIPNILPAEVIGTTSPYPTVVKVTVAHHMARGIDPNLSG